MAYQGTSILSPGKHSVFPCNREGKKKIGQFDGSLSLQKCIFPKIKMFYMSANSCWSSVTGLVPGWDNR